MPKISIALLAFLVSALGLASCSSTGPTCTDADGDGYGPEESCLGPDCDDTFAEINPGETETPYDGVDNDCDASTLDDDLDGDGHLHATDCDDTNDQIHPGSPEVCDDGVDNDCDGLTDSQEKHCSPCGSDTDCDDGNSCSLDTCVQGYCRNEVAADGHPCDDGFYCTVEDDCTHGYCIGSARDCADEIGCTVDSCVEAEDRCDHHPLPDPGAEGASIGITCANLLDDDCDGITDGDDPDCWTCVDSECDDGNPCTDDACDGPVCANTDLDDGTPCEDGSYCTVGETCLDGVCPQGTARDCDDGQTCTDDSCSEENNRCVNTWRTRPGQEGLEVPDTCDNQVDDDCDTLTDNDDPNCWSCVEDHECPDGNPCTDDVCAAGQCENPPVAGNPTCNDGLYCSVEEVCTDGLCGPGNDRDCADAEHCTVDSCDEETDGCVHTWEEKPGDEGLSAAGSCDNLIDDDCDGVTDLPDPDCWQGHCAAILSADPELIPPDGVSTSTITAQIINDAGESMPDTTAVIFATTHGTFVDSGTPTTTAPVAAGTATAVLQSEPLGEDTEVSVTATFTCDNGQEAQGATTLTFGQLPWLIVPGAGIGPVEVSQSLNSFFTLGQTRAVLQEAGSPVGATTFTLSFLGNSLWVSGIDSNPNPNLAFDDADHVISTVAWEGLYAETEEGLKPGSTLSEVHAVPRFSNPDRSAEVPPYGEYPGGKMEYYFTEGLFVGYELDTSTFFTVTRLYPQPPDGTIDPANARLIFGSTAIECGNGFLTGSLRGVHRGALGLPDWAYLFTAPIETAYGTVDVQFYIDSYRILGMEFIGGDDTIFIYDVNRLVAINLYAPYYGTTAAGNGLGSTRAEWESELGAASSTVINPATGSLIHIYTASADHDFAITYTNDGASPNDIAVYLVLNYIQGS